MEISEIESIQENLFEVEQLSEVICNIDADTMFAKETLTAIKHLADMINTDVRKTNEIVNKSLDKETK